MTIRQVRRRCAALLADDERPAEERDRLVELMVLLARLGPPPDPEDLYPRWAELQGGFLGATAGTDPEWLEEAFLELYCHLHGYEAPYSAAERARFDEVGGYWCHAGGLSPILRAGRWIRADSVSADLGAGNGLQLLLVQVLDPHVRSIQIELSARMVAAGKALQEWLGIPGRRVEWIVGDVIEHSVTGVDFLYLYRPVRPEGEEGAEYYRRLAAELEASAKPVVVFSVADPLHQFFSDRFRVHSSDGQLTCWRGPVELL